GAVAVANEDTDRLPGVVHSHQVPLGVFVEIDGDDGPRAEAHGDVYRRAERAVAIAEQESNGAGIAAVVVGNRHVELAVGIEILDSDRVRIQIRMDRGRNEELAIDRKGRN